MNTQVMEGYRLSPQQLYFWTLQKRADRHSNTVSAAFVLDGIPDDAGIQRALDQVIERHEILRTVFSHLGALQFPVQVIRPETHVWLPPLNLSAIETRVPWPDELKKVYGEFRSNRWDFQNGPLLQAQIVRLPSSRKAVMIKASKVCCDKTGLHNVITEMLQTYGRHAVQEPAQLAQYADISEYLNETLESEATAPGRQFWKRWRSSLFPPLQPAADATGQDSGKDGSLCWTIDPELAVKVDELATQTEASVADVLLACWQVILSRYFQQDQFAIGVVGNGRKLEGLESIPGTFERTLPLRCRINQEHSFKELIEDVVQIREALIQWQDYFSHDEFDDKITDQAVAFECAAFPRLPEASPAVAYFTTDEGLYPHQLKLLCSWRIEAPIFQILHQHGALTESDAAALQDQFQTLLTNALASPQEAVKALSSLSSATRTFLLYELNSTEAVSSATAYIHEQFQLQARRTPSRRAVVAGEISLTYGELEEKSRRLAEVLKSRGIGPESAVAVCMERCPELLVALLAVLKSGGYYIPLDADYPAERLAFVLRDSNAALIVTKTGYSPRLAGSQLPVLNVDEDWDPVHRTQDSTIQLHPYNLAYSIYTSGSTGQPKGVAISHAALSNYLSWCVQHYDLHKGHGVIVNSPMGFDLTVTTLLAPLVAGQTIYLLQGEETTQDLAAFLQKNAQFTLMKVTPAHLQILNQILDSTELSEAVHTIIIGGEALFSHHVGRWQTESPRTRLINEYGPTEATVGCSVYEIPAFHIAAGPVPIGKPITNAKMYVLDSEMQPVPFKTTGELYIGGTGLARGYAGQAALTAANFLPDPFSTKPGERLYKTGDQARHDADGTLHFLGRADDQIKLRGHRIELGEIEHVLRQHPLVQEAAVVVRNRGGQKQLMAYVAITKTDAVTAAHLQEFLSSKLPEYMVPAQTVMLDRLPLTIHGKVDKRSLPDPDSQPVGPGRQYIAPRNSTEQILANLWAKALGLKRVGINDNFFELGGDSIISIQIVNRAKQMGLGFTPRQLFRHRTIAELAEVVKTDFASPDAVSKTPSTDQVRLTPVQRWFFDQSFSHPNQWNQAMLFEAHEPVVLSSLEKALSIVVDQHDALRLRFTGKDALLVSQPGKPLTTVLDLSDTNAPRHQELLEKFAAQLQSGLDLAHGPIMRVGLIRSAGEKDKLLWVIHHLCVDVVSWGVLQSDLTTAYRQVSRGEEVTLPQRTSSFQQWSSRLYHYAQAEKSKQESDYWLSATRVHHSHLPVDFPGGQNIESASQIVWCSLDSDETTKLMQQVPKAHHTMINDVLLAALLHSFHKWSNHNTLTLDLENHGREELFDDIDLSRTVGWFTCIFPVTLTLVSTIDCIANLRAVKEQIRSIPNGGLGYGLLRYLSEDSTIREALAQSPRPEINFNYLGRSAQKMEDQPLLTACQGVLGPSYHPSSRRAYLLEITGGINSQGQLRLAFIFSRNLHRESSIQKLADGVADALREIVRNSSDHVIVPPMVDVSMAQLNSDELTRLMSELSRVEEASD